MAIDVGPTCSDRASGSNWSNKTLIMFANPANANGTIDSVCFATESENTGIEFGAFTDNGSLSFTCQSGHHCSGADLTANGVTDFSAPGDFTAFSIDSGEYIGVYGSISDISYDYTGQGGDGCWHYAGDGIGDDNTQTYTAYAGRQFSLYATGTESGGAVAPTGGLYGPLGGPLAGPI